MAYKQHKGFTIVELMIAISVFSTAMVLVLAGVIFISRQYQQASNRVALEEASRNVHQQIGESIKFSGIAQAFKAGSPYSALCVGREMYLFGNFSAPYGQTQFNNIASGLYVKPNDNGCTNLTITGATNLLPANAKVTIFTVDPVTNQITTQFVRSDSDLLDTTSGTSKLKCRSAISGREFCAVVDLYSTSIQRVGN